MNERKNKERKKREGRKEIREEIRRKERQVQIENQQWNRNKKCPWMGTLQYICPKPLQATVMILQADRNPWEVLRSVMADDWSQRSQMSVRLHLLLNTYYYNWLPCTSPQLPGTCSWGRVTLWQLTRVIHTLTRIYARFNCARQV